MVDVCILFILSQCFMHKYFLKDHFLDFFIKYFSLHCFICHPSDSTVPEDAGIEPRTVVILWLWRSHVLTTRLDLINHSARSHLQVHVQVNLDKKY
jgi:hypothetical protein